MQNSALSPQEDATYRKIAWRIVPFLFLCYVVNFIDRVNIGFAKLQLLQDLQLNNEIFGIAAGMFFAGHMMFEVPSNLLLARIGARKTLLRIMVSWGAITVSLMFVSNALTLYLLRFLLGAAEAGFFPGVILYLSYWFPDHRRGRITSLFVVALPMAGVIGGPLSGAIMGHMHHVLGLRGWQWLFLVEGVLAILLGMLSLRLITDRPQQASWLTPAEKTLLDTELDTGIARRRAVDAVPASLRDVLRSPRVYLLACIYVTIVMCLNAVGFWIPSLLRQIGIQRIGNIGWLSGVISVISAIGVVLVGRSSDYRMERRWHVTGCGLGTAVSFLLLQFVAHSAIWTAILLSIASACIYSVLSLFWTIAAAYLEGGAAASGIAVITTLGSLGGIVSPVLIGTIRTHTGDIYGGLSVVAMLLMAGMLALLRVARAPRTGLAEAEATRQY